jgi:phage terminase large subunit-like protein
MASASEDPRESARKAAALLSMRIAELSTPGWKPQPHQVPPSGDWTGWLLLAGRGAGKTDACAHWIAEHVKGPACIPGPVPHWIGIIAPTLGDAATSCYAGPSGIRAHSPSARMVQRPGGLSILWPNGSEAKLFGANTPEDVERLRSGGNRCAFWLEELAAWRYLDDCWSHIRFGLRAGPNPRWIASTTPKPRPLIKRLNDGKVKGAVLSRASYQDNAHLPEHIKQALEEEYAGTQLGRQELYAEVIEQDENALWTRDCIDANRWDPDDLPKFQRVTVGVDPSGGAGEQGIVVSAKATLPGLDGRPMPHGFVLADYSVHLNPIGWGRRAVQAAIDFEADDIAVERNFGGDMAIATVRSAADYMGVNIPIREVQATRGKRVRAEPLSALMEQGRYHHAGVFPALEQQMCTWYPELGWSPDRLDAMVWGGWHNKVVKTAQSSGRGFGNSAALDRAIG